MKFKSALEFAPILFRAHSASASSSARSFQFYFAVTLKWIIIGPLCLLIKDTTATVDVSSEQP